MNRSIKRGIVIAGVFLALPGLPCLFSYLCMLPASGLYGAGSTTATGLFSLTALAATLGAGGAAIWHGSRSLKNTPSKLQKLPPTWMLVGIFCILVLITASAGAGYLLSPVLLAAAALPPLWSVSWFTRHDPGGLTWRRGLVAFAGGATVSVFIALLLEILFPTIILALVLDLADVALESMERLLAALANEDVASAIASPGFIYAFVQVAIIAPLAEELAKPLVTLPLIGRLTRRDAFLVGAMAGAGFATLENVLYTGFGAYYTTALHSAGGILAVRALGGAIHPLGSGLVALGWHDLFKKRAAAGSNWLLRFGVAVGMHALWNGGTLLIITLGGAQFFGEVPAEIDVLGISAAGTTLATLIILGLAALWLGRAAGRGEEAAAETGSVLSDRAVAIWALACLVALVPAGITGLKILFW